MCKEANSVKKSEGKMDTHLGPPLTSIIIAPLNDLISMMI